MIYMTPGKDLSNNTAWCAVPAGPVTDVMRLSKHGDEYYVRVPQRLDDLVYRKIPWTLDSIAEVPELTDVLFPHRRRP